MNPYQRPLCKLALQPGLAQCHRIALISSLSRVGFEPPPVSVPGQETHALSNSAIWAWRLKVTDSLLSRNFPFCHQAHWCLLSTTTTPHFAICIGYALTTVENVTLLQGQFIGLLAPSKVLPNTNLEKRSTCEHLTNIGNAKQKGNKTIVKFSTCLYE